MNINECKYRVVVSDVFFYTEQQYDLQFNIFLFKTVSSRDTVLNLKSVFQRNSVSLSRSAQHVQNVHPKTKNQNILIF